jgi:hypothetical protein
MAGHEQSQVRPKTPQDKTKIAAGSPLAIQGIFLEILRERFNENCGLQWIWRPDITLTDVVIETGYNEETESRNTVPGLYVNRLNSVPQKMVVGDRAGVRLSDHLEGFAAIEEVAMVIDCVSADEGASAILGDLVQFTLLASQDVIQRDFGLYDFTHPTLSQTLPFEKDKTKWNTQVAFSVQFWIRWVQVPIAPLLQQISQRITLKGTTPTDHFIETVINSMRRGEVFDDCVLKEGEALPPSRISIVGPPGPPGPPGSPGLPGSITVIDAMLIDQPLTGLINSLNTVYTISPATFLHTALFKEIFYINGVRQRVGIGNDYVISESVPLAGLDTITVAYAPKINDVLTLDYYPDLP